MLQYDWCFMLVYIYFVDQATLIYYLLASVVSLFRFFGWWWFKLTRSSSLWLFFGLRAKIQTVCDFVCMSGRRVRSCKKNKKQPTVKETLRS